MKSEQSKVLPLRMKFTKIIFGLSLLSILSSCGVPQADYDKLKIEKEELQQELQQENDRLNAELDDCKFGADKIAGAVEKAYSEKNYSIARENINMLYERHPESPKNKEFKSLLVVIEKEEIAEQKRREAEEKERIRLANLDNTGMWRVGHYVDDFGEPTKQGYITNTSLISGTFSNTATENSDLNVNFLITNSSNISIQLYEYAGNNPVKAYSSESYTVLIQDKDGKRMNLKAVNYSERLRFDERASRNIHNALMKGGALKFRITEDDTPTTQYKFTIQKADWYENAYAKLKES